MRYIEWLINLLCHDKYIRVYHLSKEEIFDQLVNLEQLTFELTEVCNLNCKYCGYGELYSTHYKRRNKSMNFDIAKQIIDYMYEIWFNNPGKTYPRKIVFGFYGGEPLMNFPLIEKIINYLNGLPSIPDTVYAYNMTSNGVLLDRYQDFIAKNNIKLLLSIDGDEWGDSYRTDHKGNSSFERVFNNILKLRDCYPDYFKQHVTFNSVLHDRNNTKEIRGFIYRHFGKYPSVSELNNFGIVEEKKDEFMRMYHLIESDIHSDDEEFFQGSPEKMDLYRLIEQIAGNTYYSYNALLKKGRQTIHPTGTCIPFQKKIYVSVNGDIYVCERIDQKYVVGHVTKGKVDLNIEKIAEKYSNFYKSFEHLCSKCYRKNLCYQCMFYIIRLGERNLQCPGFTTREGIEKMVKRYLKILKQRPELYEKILKEVLLQI